MATSTNHIQDELLANLGRVTVLTKFGNITGGRTNNGAAAFLEIPYALPPGRFQDPEPLPNAFRYEEKEYIRESKYAVQPTNDGQAAGLPFEDKVGRGQPTENPLFLNIIVPPEFPSKKGFPVKVYIHGGFLQFGSPHGLSSQAQFVSAIRSEIWVNIGYRLSAFGFLAYDEPKVAGNFGFKDQWLALQWVKENIDAFGGDIDDIQLTGLSAGAHSVHQILHHASNLSRGHQAPFNSALLQSNAILINPKTPEELRPQFHALCHALKLDPDDPNVLTTLSDPAQVPASEITRVIETEKLGVYGTFRGCLNEDWIPRAPAPMEWQRSGGLARGLQACGVHSIVIGNLSEEWYLYSIAHDVPNPEDLAPNLLRYFPEPIVQGMIQRYNKSVHAGNPQRLFGEILSCGQVYLPTQILLRDLYNAGFPVARYDIRWTPEKSRTQGYVTHGSDRVLWALRIPNLTEDERDVASAWLEAVAGIFSSLRNKGAALGVPKVALTLEQDRQILWKESEGWDQIMSLIDILPGEESPN
ncbi:carboxylesterase [Pluteus cervinus]|uniref:Carboxylesterase n=1 Tax=Pluteus cervinus TaxID=181527 RepID=A0ACD3AVV8_9AGAR|nr:carboxylesterase [Pluteus cervinus]